MPAEVPGKVRRDWYIDADVAKQLRMRCAEQGVIESHAVTEAIRAMLEFDQPQGPGRHNH